MINPSYSTELRITLSESRNKVSYASSSYEAMFVSASLRNNFTVEDARRYGKRDAECSGQNS